jgi:hypothetical protein
MYEGLKGCTVIRNVSMLNNALKGSDWPLRFRRWVRTVVRKEPKAGRSATFWVCLELAPPGVPYANVYDDVHDDDA